MSAKAAEFPVRKAPDLPALNEEIAQLWRERKTFEVSVTRRADAPRWVFYEGPPSANGLPGIHHVMGRALKDLYCRYRTQRGYLVERKAGWDTHGLPVELSVEKTLGITKEDIGKSVSIEEYNAECRKAVLRYSDEWRRLTERVGYWVDLDAPYVTCDSKYMETVWWLLERLHAGGYLYRGYTIQPYSPMAGSGLSTHELNQPGAYRDVTDLTATAMFRLCALSEQQSRTATAKLATSPAERVQTQFLSPLGKKLEDVFVLAWTTTPWTLPSNTALAINPKYAYALVETTSRYDGQRVLVVVAEGLLDQVFAEAEYERVDDDAALTAEGKRKKQPYRVLTTLPGSELCGLWYEQLLPWATPAETPEQAFRVIGGDFVSLEDGTGVVHIAPTFGADDARVAKEAGVPPMRVLDTANELVPLVDLRGRFVTTLNDGMGLAGRFVKQDYYEGNAERAAAQRAAAQRAAAQSAAAQGAAAQGAGEKQESVDEQIVVWLKQHGQLFRSLKYKHSYPHCWRTDTPVIYYPLKSWFIRTTAFKDELISLNKTIHWYPPSTGEGRFGEWLEKLSDWNLSRSRFWGIPLPIWVSEDGTEFKCIGSFTQLKAEIQRSMDQGVMSEDPFADFTPGELSDENYARIDVHRPYVDRVKLVSASGKIMTREADVIDVWFDSGSMPYAQVHYPFENRSPVDDGEAFPADFIAEGVDQTRGWFFTLHAIATMVFGKVAYKHVLSNGLLVDAEGRKMSKRLGNVLDPIALLDKYGADPLRWYMITNSPPWLNLRFDVGGVDEVVRKFYGTLWSTYSFFATYANADGFTGTEAQVPVAERPLLDRWIVSQLQSTIEVATTNLDDFDATRAYRAVQTFLLDDLSNWYVRLNRRRFWKAEMGKDKLAAYQTLYESLLTICKLIAPVSPFHSERLYLDLTTRSPEQSSVHHTDFPKAETSLVDETIATQMDAIRRAASLALSVRKDRGIKVRQPLGQMTVITDDKTGAALSALVSLLSDEVNVKDVVVAGTDSDVIDRSAQLNFRAAGPRFGKQTKQVAEAIKSLDNAALVRLDRGQSIQVDVDGTSHEIEPELVKINVRGKAGSEIASDGTLTVVLDTALTPELKQEGFARELISVIQRLRKNADFEVTTRITLHAQRDPALDAALQAHGAYIQAETLCEDVRLADQLDAEAVNVEGTDLKLQVTAIA